MRLLELSFRPVQRICRLLLIAPILVLPILACSEKHNASISYKSHVSPIVKAHCLECHNKDGVGTENSGLNMDTYENLLIGTRLGPVIIPGDALSSTLVLLVEGKADPSINMPHGNRQALSEEQIQIIKDWINQGAKNN